jgi:uncharacterized linocin/CFP29 family protein
LRGAGRRGHSDRRRLRAVPGSGYDRALNRLRDEGVDGPYAIALDEECYKSLTETTHGGYPALDHIRHLVDGPLVWAPGVDGSVVLSMRGDDF